MIYISTIKLILEGQDTMAKTKVKPLSKTECDILVCRLQGALYEGDQKRIEKILEEVRKRVKELKYNNMWFGK